MHVDNNNKFSETVLPRQACWHDQQTPEHIPPPLSRLLPWLPQSEQEVERLSPGMNRKHGQPQLYATSQTNQTNLRNCQLDSKQYTFKINIKILLF